MNPPPQPPPSGRGPWRRRGVRAGAFLFAGLALVGLAFAIGEAMGWPFLAGPAERLLSERLQRDVRIEALAAADEKAVDRFRLHLLGGVDLRAGRLVVANAPWSSPDPLLDARDVQLRLRWSDLMALRSGEALRMRSLTAGTLHLKLQRERDGRANWQFNAAQSSGRDGQRDDAWAGYDGARFDRLVVGNGSVSLADAVQQVTLNAGFSLAEGREAESAAPQQPGAAEVPLGVRAQAEGSYRGLPLQAKAETGSALPWLDSDPHSPAVPVELHLRVGRAALDFNGEVRDLLGRQGLKGEYAVSGPSLAAVGEPLHVVLPTTRPFAMRGRLTRDGTRWFTVIDQATVGESRLAGEFRFDLPPDATPNLTGRLRGPALILKDLGPAIGTPTEAAAHPPPPGKVLPDRPFDLPSLRAMNANVLIALDKLDLGTTLLQPIQPLHAQLLLRDGVLEVKDIDAHMAQGDLSGRVQLDGRAVLARWQADLTGTGLQLEQWVKPLQRAKGPPYASGRVGAMLSLRGEGRSSAELLASADGRLVLSWAQGSVSHLAMEAAGIDVAQSLGVMLKGDDALPVQCGAGDLTIKDGQITPRVLLVDTPDSTLWVAGGLSLADERLQLVARVEPKDWSPLALRTPLHIDGSFAKPQVSLEKGPLAKRAVPAALLAMVNPLAALLPLIDHGDPKKTDTKVQACHDVVARYGPKLVGIG